MHGLGDHGFVPHFDRRARKTSVTQTVYHAVADEVVPFKGVAQAIGRQLGLPVESREREHFGWFANLGGADMSASSERTCTLGLEPTGPSLLTDLDRAGYYAG